jgi:hypothetical protein
VPVAGSQSRTVSSSESVQPVGLFLRERRRTVQARYENPVVLPLPRVRQRRISVIVLVLPFRELRLAEIPVDVMVTRDHHDPLGFQAQLPADLIKKGTRLAELRPLSRSAISPDRMTRSMDGTPMSASPETSRIS